MKKLLITCTALLGFCTLGPLARAGGDAPYTEDERPAPRVIVRHETHFFLPLPLPIPVPFFAASGPWCGPRIVYGPRPYWRRWHPYAYRRGCF